MRPGSRSGRLPLLACGLLVVAGACQSAEDLSLPTQADLDGAYGEGVAVALDGNVVDVRVRQGVDQLRRGGQVWAKAGPYIYLFTPQTRDLLAGFGGIGGVRVTTLDTRGNLIARALLERSTLNSVTWTRAINTAGRARVDGTRRPQTMVDLTDYGEEHTDYEYSNEYVRSNR